MKKKVTNYCYLAKSILEKQNYRKNFKLEFVLE